MPGVASTLATMIGLGVGIDYALFIVTRHKLQLGEGMELRESIARATATAGGAVVFAGFTVVIALCSLAFAGIPLVTHARLHRRDRGRRRGLRRGDAAAGDAGRARPAHQLAARPARQDPPRRPRAARLAPLGASGSPTRPWRSAIAALAILVVLALPIFQLELGQNDISALPKETTSRQAYDGLNKGFGPGVNGPLLIASEFELAASEAKTACCRAAARKRSASAADVAAVSEPTARQGGHGRGLHGDLEIGAWADETVRPGRRPARHDDPGGAEGDRRRVLRRRPDRRLHRPRRPRSPTSCR